ncbi:type II toxin-antitoxin system VapC family toxin [Duganella fentianensis]|uniref:type II toxin-antitoxin system VapC family toxin n=1 Tax=Duganella fentianensis TaxID=2692177 RepID=UPI0032B1A3D8
MLDTCICSFIMREQALPVLQRLAFAVAQNDRIVISAITYAEMRYGQIGKKARPQHKILVDEFVLRLDAIMPWDRAAVDATIEVRTPLGKLGRPISENDSAIAGHAIATGSVLVTNNVREFARVAGLNYEDWAS